MGFFSTVATGYKIWGHEIAFAVKNNSDKILTGSGAGIMAIGAGLFARTAAKEETRKAIEEANLVIEQCKNEIRATKEAENVDKTAVKKAKKAYVKARVKKIVTVGRKHAIPMAVEATGMALVGLGMVDSKHKLEKSSAATAVVAAEFMAYRKNVIAKEGAEADREYLTTKIVKNETAIVEKTDPETGEITTEVVPGSSFVVDADPSALKFWFSPETCPAFWDDNRDLLIHKLDHKVEEMEIRLRTCKHLTLNDQRAMFEGLVKGSMDVGIGGILGRVYVWDDPYYGRHVNWHYQEDRDFMEGSTNGVWILFDVDKEPIVNKIGKKFTEVEK